MKKLLLIFGLSCSIASAQVYSNLIVFGDSQSDIGNMPESSNAGVNRPFYFDGLPYNLYVPLSNPVYGDQDTATDHLFAQLFNTTDLPPQPLINQSVRVGRSVNWSQYLFVTLKAKGQLQSNELIPWVMLYASTHPYAHNVSVNYAFAGALSDNHCADEGYTLVADNFCNAPAIFNTQNIYRQHPTDDDLRRAMLIPGVQMQVALFSADVTAGRVAVDSNTLYVLWSGANDLTKAFLNLLQGGTFTEFYHRVKENLPDLLAGVDDSAIVQLHQLGAKNIVIISEQNLGLTPAASRLMGTYHSFWGRYLSAYALDFLVLRYNLAVAEKMLVLKTRYPDLNLHWVNLQTLFNHASLIPGAPFFKNLGLACQNKDAATYQAILHGDLVFCTDYLYWNRAHMTYQGNRMVAEAILRALSL